MDNPWHPDILSFFPLFFENPIRTIYSHTTVKLQKWNFRYWVIALAFAGILIGTKMILNILAGTAGDSLSFHRGMKFSTVDEDNDPILLDACTNSHPGGWWFSNCLESNLNGVFNAKTNTLATLYWKTISQAIIQTEMKIQAYKKGILIYNLVISELVW